MFELLILMGRERERKKNVTFDHNYLHGLRQTVSNDQEYVLGVNDTWRDLFSLMIFHTDKQTNDEKQNWLSSTHFLLA